MWLCLSQKGCRLQSAVEEEQSVYFTAKLQDPAGTSCSQTLGGERAGGGARGIGGVGLACSWAPSGNPTSAAGGLQSAAKLHNKGQKPCSWHRPWLPSSLLRVAVWNCHFPDFFQAPSHRGEEIQPRTKHPDNYANTKYFEIIPGQAQPSTHCLQSHRAARAPCKVPAPGPKRSH